MPSIGRFEVVQPGDGEVTRLPLTLQDDAGAFVLGVAWNAAGMDVEYSKPGGTFANFPDFAAENWHEVGRGAYEVIIDGDVPAEKALLDTSGDFSLYVKTDATNSDFALSAYNVASADVTREDVWTDARAAKLDAIDPGGAYVVTRTIKDTLDNALSDIKVTIQGDAAGVADGTIIAKMTTSSSGHVTFNLDADTYHLLTPSSIAWQASDTTIVVAANSTGDIAVTAQTLPAPSAPDKFVIIVNAADEFADMVGAGDWELRITDVKPRALDSGDLVQITERNPLEPDAEGQLSFEISKETTHLSMDIAVTSTGGSRHHQIAVAVDPTAANEEDQIYLSDLM